MLQNSDVYAVHYKPTESLKTKTQRQNVVRDDASRNRTHNWRDKVKISDNYSTKGDFVEILTEFQSVQNGHFGLINYLKYRIELRNKNTQPNDSAPYRATKVQGGRKIRIGKDASRKYY